MTVIRFGAHVGRRDGGYDLRCPVQLEAGLDEAARCGCSQPFPCAWCGSHDSDQLGVRHHFDETGSVVFEPAAQRVVEL
jgi:hypothetical protein